jgi:hypothetical protein
VGGAQRNGSAFLSGAVYAFRRSAGAWSQVSYIKASNTDGQDGFGGTSIDTVSRGPSVGIALWSDGLTLVVGAPGEDSAATGVNGDQTDNSAVSSGAVYVY